MEKEIEVNERAAVWCAEGSGAVKIEVDCLLFPLKEWRPQ